MKRGFFRIRFNDGVASWYSELPPAIQDRFAAAWVRYTITGVEPPENVIPAEVWKDLKELVAVIYSNGHICGHGGAYDWHDTNRIMERVRINWNRKVRW